VTILGLLSDSEKHNLLSKSWILVNTSAREALPITFLEACAHETAILSRVNPDGYASRFGFHVKDGNFENGLKTLLNDDLWTIKGKEARKFAEKNHEVNSVMDKWKKIYNSISCN
jgi:glycosyltransferase involved in cell wall biosynthesis